MTTMQKQILILGGYGGVGNVLASCLLQYTTVDLSIAGPNLEKAETLASQLRQTFPDRPIRAVYADARQKESLLKAFKGTDLVIVTATVADYMDNAGAALECGADMIDILFRSDVPACLEKYRARVESDQRIFISQGRFHPVCPRLLSGMRGISLTATIRPTSVL